MAVKFNTELIEGFKKETEEKVKAILSPEERIMDLYQGKGADEVIQKFMDGKSLIENIGIELLDDYPNNPFHKIDGEKLEEFVGSIKEFGILTPLIVRKKDDGRYEILAGHNRKYAAIDAGLKTVPCSVVEADDTEASVIVAITNNQRENTTDLEWGWAYRNTLEVIKHQGRVVDDTSRHDGEKLDERETSISIVAKRYGVGERTAQRKIRLTYLTEQLYETLVKAKASQGIMVDLSYLTPVDQANLASEIAWNNLVITDELAASLKKIAQEKAGEDIGIDNLYAFVRINGEEKEKPKRPRKYMVGDEFFPSEIKKQDRESYIEKALLYILENGIRLTEEEHENDN